MTISVDVAEELEQWLVFVQAGQMYGVRVPAVQEIIRVPAITPVPGAPLGVEGVMNLRGRIVPVLDLSARLGLPAHNTSKANRIVITQAAGRTVGLHVESVTEVLGLAASAWDLASDILQGLPHSDCFVGVCRVEDRLLMGLDLSELLILLPGETGESHEGTAGHGG